MKISACFITKGEPSLRAAVESVWPFVDEVVVVYTGDREDAGRIAWARDLADVFEEFYEANDEVGLADFAKARQRSFDLASGGAAIWLDSDDRIVGGERLREVVETAPKGRAALLSLPYEYRRDEKTGECDVLQWRERIAIPPGAFRWEHPVHETLEPDVAGAALGTSEAVRVIHERKGEPDFARNERILRRQLDADPKDARARFYLALSFYDRGAHADAKTEFEAVLRTDGATADECVMALLRLSWMAIGRGDPAQAIGVARRAFLLRPWDACCFALARAWHAKARTSSGAEERDAWERAAFWARAGLAVPPAKTGLWVNPLDRAAYVHATLNEALARIGDLEGARESALAALSAAPHFDEVRANLLVFEAAIAAKAAEKVEREAAALFGAGKLSRSNLDAVRAAGGRPPERAEGSLDFVFLCGDGWEVWNPATIEERGIGGSEQAVANLARELVALGHRARVFASCGSARVYEGVEYAPTAAYRRVRDCDVLVAWRDAAAVEQVRAKARLLWAHDTAVANPSEWRFALADRVLALSSWHRECLLRAYGDEFGLAPEKLFLTRNGADLSHFDGPPVKRDPRRAIYSSSPTRGLPTLLRLWPAIRAKVPGAELHVFYGFETWTAMARARGDERQLRMIEEIGAAMEALSDAGVVYRGRVAPRVLAEEMRAAGVWLFPSKNEVESGPWFETSCIGAMEAQLAGLRIVTTPVGALPETAFSADFVEADDFDAAWERDFVAASVDALSGDREKSREEVAKSARRLFGWRPVAEQWVALAREIIGAEAAKAAERTTG